MLRPDFDRFGAWFTMGNINLHLINGILIIIIIISIIIMITIVIILMMPMIIDQISGRPIVHPDDDLIVSHIAFDIGTEEKMDKLIRYLDNDMMMKMTRQ